MKKQTVAQAISEQMKKVALSMSHDQRVKNGKTSWKTRRANLAKKLEAT